MGARWWWAAGILLGSVAGCGGKGADEDSGTFDPDAREGSVVGQCEDRVDNDRDGDIDCDDTDCWGKPACNTGWQTAPTSSGTGSGTGATGTGTGATGTGTGATGTGTGATGTGTGSVTSFTPVITTFDPPGCGAGIRWKYRLVLDGWSLRNAMNAFETGVGTVALRWNEENHLESIYADVGPPTEELAIALWEGVSVGEYVQDYNTVYRCGLHDGPTASNTYAARVYDLDDNFADCAFGLDPFAPANAISSVRNGTAWDYAVHAEPSGDWSTEFNASCGIFEFY